MACLLYLQCTHTLQRCHFRLETLHFINTGEKLEFVNMATTYHKEERANHGGPDPSKN